MSEERHITVTGHRAADPTDKDSVEIRRGPHACLFPTWTGDVLPHELVHVAVEQVFPVEGLVRLLGRGVSLDDLTGTVAPREALQAEMLVAAFQWRCFGEGRVGDTPLAERLAELCRSFGVPCPEFTALELEAGARQVTWLTQRWLALPPGALLQATVPAEVPAHTRFSAREPARS